MKIIVEYLIIFLLLVKEMMFGFGDKLQPYSGTVKLMDELVKDFMTNLVSLSIEWLFVDFTFYGYI